MNAANLLKALPLAGLLLWSCQAGKTEQQTAAGPDSTGSGWAMLPFVKIDSVNPVLTPSPKLTFTDPIWKRPVRWEEKDVFNPAALVRDGQVILLYRAEDKLGKFAGVSRIGLATSPDGLHFTKEPRPVFYPQPDAWKKYEWEGGCEDPRVVQAPDGRYVMTYTSYDGKTARLMLATSPDLRNWTKHGPVLGEGRHLNTWSKSGAIVARQNGDRIVAEKIGGRYYMYFGDTSLFLASSEDLIAWTPLENPDGTLRPVLRPRPGFFDGQLVEPGPYALLTDKGILLLYNAATKQGDKLIYAAGQALFAASAPENTLARLHNHFFFPDRPYELTGQVNNVVFVEGMVPFRGKWLLYYGTADSKIAVAVYDPEASLTELKGTVK